MGTRVSPNCPARLLLASLNRRTAGGGRCGWVARAGCWLLPYWPPSIILCGRQLLSELAEGAICPRQLSPVACLTCGAHGHCRDLGDEGNPRIAFARRGWLGSRFALLSEACGRRWSMTRTTVMDTNA